MTKDWKDAAEEYAYAELNRGTLRGEARFWLHSGLKQGFQAGAKHGYEQLKHQIAERDAGLERILASLGVLDVKLDAAIAERNRLRTRLEDAEAVLLFYFQNYDESDEGLSARAYFAKHAGEGKK